MKYHIDSDKKLFIEGKPCRMPEDWPATKALDLGPILVVLSTSSPDTPDSNIFAFDRDCNLLWRVEPWFTAEEKRELLKFPGMTENEVANPYTRIGVLKDNALYADTWHGGSVRIDTATGARTIVLRPNYKS